MERAKFFLFHEKNNVSTISDKYKKSFSGLNKGVFTVPYSQSKLLIVTMQNTFLLSVSATRRYYVKHIFTLRPSSSSLLRLTFVALCPCCSRYYAERFLTL